MNVATKTRKHEKCFWLRAFVFSWLIAVAGSAEAAPAQQAVTFTKDIAPIVWSRCASCHRPGEIGPFSLLTYDDVRRHAAQIAIVTARRIMPPWKPLPGKGDFQAERRLSDAELQTLQKKLEALESSRVQREDVGWQGLVKLYETMKPRDAATIFNELDMPVLLQVLDRMKEGKAALILSAMHPDRAREITDGLAHLRVRDPTAARDRG